MTDTQPTYLQRTRTVLQRVQDKRPNMQPYFRQSVENGDEYLAHRLQLDDETYRDMGEPDVVTLTVHPGDRLNDGSVLLDLSAEQANCCARTLQQSEPICDLLSEQVASNNYPSRMMAKHKAAEVPRPICAHA
jgi:hypothetical protein